MKTSFRLVVISMAFVHFAAWSFQNRPLAPQLAWPLSQSGSQPAYILWDYMASLQASLERQRQQTQTVWGYPVTAWMTDIEPTNPGLGFSYINGEPVKWGAWFWMRVERPDSAGGPVNFRLVGGATGRPICPVEFSQGTVAVTNKPLGQDATVFCLSGKPRRLQSCKATGVGNPILVEARVKAQTETDFDIGALKFIRDYDSIRGQWSHSFQSRAFNLSAASGAATCRGLSFNLSGLIGQRCFRFLTNAELGVAGAIDVVLRTYDGQELSFHQPDGLPRSVAANSSIAIVGFGAASTVRHRTADGAFEMFDASGKLVEIVRANGARVQVNYDSVSNPSSIVEVQTGRTLLLSHYPTGEVMSLTDPNGRQITYNYDGPSALGTAVDGLAQIRRLTSVVFQDGKSRTYWYNEPEHTNGSRLPMALTGVVDELEQRYSTFKYTSEGYALSTSLPLGVNAFSVAGNGDVVDPIGTVRRYNSTLVGSTVPSTVVSGGLFAGATLPRGVNQPGGSGCEAANSHLAYDNRGNVLSKVNFNAERSCHAYDTTRDLETARVEGLLAGSSCPSNIATYAPAAGERKISTRWHPDWQFKIAVAEPGRITYSVYNGQVDPLSNNVAICAPTTALLPDGKPIAVKCRQIEVATTDLTGGLGISAPIDPSVAPRIDSWTYSEVGNVLTHDGPRTDVADVTTYEYYETTSFSGLAPTEIGYTRGDVRRITNPLGQIVEFRAYNRSGQVLDMLDVSNNVVTTYTYDERLRLSSMTLAGDTTAWEYWPMGQVKKVTRPDSSWSYFEYDGAHRLWRISDSFGNKVTYLLDNLGNRTEEIFTDPSGTPRRNVARGIDALGRVQQITGRE